MFIQLFLLVPLSFPTFCNHYPNFWDVLLPSNSMWVSTFYEILKCMRFADLCSLFLFTFYTASQLFCNWACLLHVYILLAWYMLGMNIVSECVIEEWRELIGKIMTHNTEWDRHETLWPAIAEQSGCKVLRWCSVESADEEWSGSNMLPHLALVRRAV